MAEATKSKLANIYKEMFGKHSLSLKRIENKIVRIGIDTRVTAKNTSVLPAMAKNMNLMRLNMEKMVKLSGGTPSGGKNSPSPNSQSDGGTGGFFGGLFSLLSGALSGAGSILSALIPSLSGFFGALIKAIIATGIITLALQQLSPETRERLNKFIIDALVGFFDAVKDGFIKLKDLMTDPKVVKSFQGAVSAIVDTIVAAIKLVFTTQIQTPLGQYSLGTIVTSLVLGFVGLKAAAAAAAAALLSIGRGPIVPSGAPGAPGGKGGKMGGFGKFAALLGVGLTLKHIYDMFGGKKEAEAALGEPSPGTPGASPPGTSGASPGTPGASPPGTSENTVPKTTTGEKIIKGAVLGLETYGAVQLVRQLPSASAGPSKAPGPFDHLKGKELTSFGTVGENREMAKNKGLWQKIIDVITKAVKKGASMSMISKFGAKFGYWAAAKFATVVAGVAAAPFSAGFSLLISALGALLLVYDIYQIYEFFVNLEKELAQDEKDSKIIREESPTSFRFDPASDFMGYNPSPVPNAPANAAGRNTPAQVPTAAAPPWQRGPGDRGPSAAPAGAAPAGATSTNAERIIDGIFRAREREGQGTTNNSGSIDPSRTTFAQLSREQQDAFLNKQLEVESGGNRNALAYRLNNPGAMLYADWQKQFGGERAGPGYGVGSVKGKFAKFPTMEKGREAQRALWSSPTYANLPLDKALNLWVTGDPNKDYDKNMRASITGYKNAMFAAIGSQQLAAASSSSLTPSSNNASPAQEPSVPNTGNALMNIFAGYLKYREEYMQKSGASAQVITNSGNTTVNQGGGTGGQSVNPYNDDIMKYLLKPVT